MPTLSYNPLKKLSFSTHRGDGDSDKSPTPFVALITRRLWRLSPLGVLKMNEPAIQHDEAVRATATEWAYEQVLPRALALPDAEIGPARLDVARAVDVALGSLQRVAPLHEELEAFSEFDVGTLDELRQLSEALFRAHARATRVSGDDPVAVLADEGYALRRHLLTAARALAAGGVLAEARIAEISAGRGYLDLATDLQALRETFLDAREAIDGKTLVTDPDLRRAGQLGPELRDALAVRDVGSNVEPDAIEIRARIFVLFRNSYESLRRAVYFIRWDEGDAGELVPSLFTQRRRRSADRVDDVAATEASAQDTAGSSPAAPTRSLSVVPAAPITNVS